MGNDVHFFEAVSANRINASQGVISGVRVLGASSKRGRFYSEQAREDAVNLYEGIGVNLNHPEEEDAYRNRGVLTETFGELRNVRHDKNRQAVYADHHFPVSHPYAQTYIENARRFPTQLGFSHNASGKSHQKDGLTHVESLDSAVSVDLVDRAATNKSLFESEKPMARRKVKKLLFEMEPELLDEPVEMAMDAPMDAPVDAPVDAATGNGANGDVKAAFRAAVMAIFDDEALNAAETAVRIREVLKVHEKLSKAPTAEVVDEEAIEEVAPEEELPEEEEELLGAGMESLRSTVRTLRNDNKTLRVHADVQGLLESNSRKATSDQFTALCKLTGSERLAMLQALPKSNGRTSRPVASPGRLQESDGEIETMWNERVKAARTKIGG